jgi:hypothetical protein
MTQPVPSPTAKFEHIWHALMTVLGKNHHGLWQRNKAILHDVNQLMGGK